MAGFLGEGPFEKMGVKTFELARESPFLGLSQIFDLLGQGFPVYFVHSAGTQEPSRFLSPRIVVGFVQRANFSGFHKPPSFCKWFDVLLRRLCPI